MRIARLLIIASLLAPSLVRGQDVESSAELRWRNGDVLPGVPLEGDADRIRWSSPIFADDLTVDATVLDSIVFSGGTVKPEEDFRIGTVSGDVFSADVFRADATSFVFSSRRFGRVRIRRDAVHSLTRLVHPNLVYDGSRFRAPNGRMQALDGTVEKPDWTRSLGGHPQTHRKSASVFRAVDLPTSFELEIDLETRRLPVRGSFWRLERISRRPSGSRPGRTSWSSCKTRSSSPS